VGTYNHDSAAKLKGVLRKGGIRGGGLCVNDVTDKKVLHRTW